MPEETRRFLDLKQAELKEAVLSNDIPTIHLLVRENNELLTYIPKKEGKCILLIACSKANVSAETVNALLDLGADPRTRNSFDGWEALHWAASYNKFDILNTLLTRNPEIINAVDKNENNALQVLLDFGDKESADFQKCAELLIEKEIHVNHKNINNFSALDIAEKKAPGHNVINIIKNQASRSANIDLTEGQTLYEYLKQDDEDQFIKFKAGNIEKWVNYGKEEEQHTLLQFCCKKNLDRAAIHLLDKGADPDLNSNKNKMKPIIMAAGHANKELLKALLKKYKSILETPGALLSEVIKYIDREQHDNMGCYRIFIEEIKNLNLDERAYKLNETDENGDTALNYAVIYADPDIVEELLSLGASLGAKNKNGVMPIDHIEPEVLRRHLDKCVIFDLKSMKRKEKEFSVTFNYRTLMPPYLELSENEVHCDKDVEAPNLKKKFIQNLVHETKVMDAMSQNTELKEILKHPVITSFLHLKWMRIQWLFWVNLALYLFFALSFLVYTYTIYTNNITLPYVITICFKLVLFSIWSAFMLRELFQMILDPRKYFTSFENYVEISLIILCAIIGISSTIEKQRIKELFSLAILLLSFELVLALGQHPTFSTYVVIFRTVSCNFYKFLMWYSLPIFAFAISFFLLFNDEVHDAEESKNNGTTKESKNDDANLFNHPLLSLFKTLIMLTGEFDSGSIKFNEESLIIDKLIFLAFVVTIAVILLNLLSGLAVSDTQQIQDNAELVGYISRAQFISNVESMLIGIAKFLQKLSDKIDWSTSHNWNRAVKYIVRFVAKIACIFPICFNYELSFYPGKNGLIDKTWCKTNKGFFPNICLMSKTVMKTRDIIKTERDKNNNKTDNRIKKIEDNVNTLLELLEKKIL